MPKTLPEIVQEKAIATAALERYCRSMEHVSPAFHQVAELLHRSAQWLGTISSQLSGRPVKLTKQELNADAQFYRQVLQNVVEQFEYSEAAKLTPTCSVKAVTAHDGGFAPSNLAPHIAYALNEAKLALLKGNPDASNNLT